jgi:hypothetical protein
MIRSIRFIRADVAAAAGLALIIAFQPLAAQAGCKFSVVKSANAVQDGNDLFAVSATSATDAWAVGFYIPSQGKDFALAEHWNGTAWSPALPLNPSPSFDYLDGVSAVSPTDVWAVGQYLTGSGAYQPLIEHWNGSAWLMVPSPNTGGLSILRAVKALSAKNVWAVGTTFLSGSQSNTLIEHWNGLAWAIVPSPNPGNQINDLTSITGDLTALWASGDFLQNTAYRTAVLRDQNRVWNKLQTQNVNTKSNNLNAILEIPGIRIYAVGAYQKDSNFNTLIESWDGTKFVIQPSPNKGTGSTELFGLAGSQMTGVIAVGQYFQGSYFRTFALKLNGPAWQIVPSDNVGTFDNFLNGAVAIPGTDDAWAVGGTNNANFTPHQTLVERFNC